MRASEPSLNSAEASQLLLGLWRQPKLLPAQAGLPLQRVEGGLALLGGQLRHLLDPRGLLLAREVRVGRQLEAVRGVLVRVRVRVRLGFGLG